MSLHVDQLHLRTVQVVGEEQVGRILKSLFFEIRLFLSDGLQLDLSMIFLLLRLIRLRNFRTEPVIRLKCKTLSLPAFVFSAMLRKV